MIVGAYRADQTHVDSGAAYVFSLDGDQWIEQQKLTAPAPAAGYAFGSSVAIHGHRVIVGAWETTMGNAGSTYLFTSDGNQWSQQRRITAFGATDGDMFGSSIALRGALAIAGAPGTDGPRRDRTVASVFHAAGTSVFSGRVRATRVSQFFLVPVLSLGDHPAGAVRGGGFRALHE